MGVYYETIPDNLLSWIKEQQMLWVYVPPLPNPISLPLPFLPTSNSPHSGTAPLSPTGHINISPKSCIVNGAPSFGIPNPSTFWYQDLTGSGIETHAHLYEPSNARICIMFSAFHGPPKIVRIWGTGRVLENGSEEFEVRYAISIFHDDFL